MNLEELDREEKLLIEFYRSLPDPPTVDAKAVIVWKWEDAPEHYKLICNAGGDEEWLAFVPSHLCWDSDVLWIESSYFGNDHEVTVIKGGVLVCGSH